MTEVFPILATVMVIAGIVLSIRLAKKISLGTVEGGSWDALQSEPPGQTEVPWELKVVEQQLVWPDRRQGAPIVALLNQLVEASNLDSTRYALPTTATRSQVEWLVAELERETGMANKGQGL